MVEYDHMAELGLVEDKQLVIPDVGFLTRNDPLRDLCDRYIRDGGRIYDVLSRYDSVISYALSREDGNCGSTARLLVPLLLANGITDKGAYDVLKKSLKITKGGDSVLTYLQNQLPTFICSETYEHQMLLLSDKLNIPATNISCNMFSFDDMILLKPDARKIREALPHIANCPLSTESYTTGERKFLTAEDSVTIDTVDTKLIKELDKMEIMETVRNDLKLSGNEKAYGVLELCRKNEIGLMDTAYVGTRNSDFPALDIIRDSGGLALSFGGTDYTIRGCNAAVFSDRPIVAAVLINEFYNGGIESVKEMIDHWSIEGLQNWPCADRNLVNQLIAEFPKGLPEAYNVDRRNVRDVTQKFLKYKAKTKKRK